MPNTIQFVYELQKAGKPFELMLYPKSRHGVDRSAARQALARTDARIHAADVEAREHGHWDRNRNCATVAVTGASGCVSLVRPVQARQASCRSGACMGARTDSRTRVLSTCGRTQDCLCCTNCTPRLQRRSQVSRRLKSCGSLGACQYRGGLQAPHASGVRPVSRDCPLVHRRTARTIWTRR